MMMKEEKLLKIRCTDTEYENEILLKIVYNFCFICVVIHENMDTNVE